VARSKPANGIGVGSPRDDVPDAALQHESQWFDRPIHGARPLAAPVADLYALGLPDRSGEQLEIAQLLRRLEPAGGIEVETLRHPTGPRPKLGRQRGHDLQACRGDDRAKSKLRGRARHTGQEHGLGFVRGQARQAGAVAVHQPDAAMRASFRVDRNAGLGQRLDVAIDRPNGHLELPGQLTCRHPVACLEQEEDVDESAGAHS
jgi:hypothetical protein